MLRFHKSIALIICMVTGFIYADAQLLRLPDVVNFKNTTGRRVGVTDIQINWNAPGVKGREGKIWGTDVAYFGEQVLGFGSDKPSPWRAGANESTTISFSTDVNINGKKLPAGTYGFFIELHPESSTIIFNENTKGWGSYFYDKSLDVLRVSTVQQKNLPASKERLEYTFSNQTPGSVEVALEWEKWRIPFTVSVDLVKTTLASIQSQLSGAMGFDPASLEAGANWSLQQNVNFQQALGWINVATDPNLGGIKTFRSQTIKAGLLEKLNRNDEAEQIMTAAMKTASAFDLHGYGRQLLATGKTKEAMAVFENNYKTHKGAWPTNVGMMRGYSATGDLKNALKYARLALEQAPDEVNRKALEQSIQKLAAGTPL